jgi:hypothetical protein
MALMVGRGRARYNNLIANRTNVCGGVKKAGLANLSGFPSVMSLNHNLARVQTKRSDVCVISSVIQTQRIGYRATLG